VLAEFFNGVYVKEYVSNMPDFPMRCHDEFNSLSISEDYFLLKLSQLITSKAVSPDKIHPWILKDCCHGLCKPLLMLYNLSLKCGKLPSDWKQALVTPILKKRIQIRYDPNNYRPISLTSQVCKILESFVSSSITRFLTQHRLISKH